MTVNYRFKQFSLTTFSSGKNLWNFTIFQKHSRNQNRNQLYKKLLYDNEDMEEQCKKNDKPFLGNINKINNKTYMQSIQMNQSRQHHVKNSALPQE